MPPDIFCRLTEEKNQAYLNEMPQLLLAAVLKKKKISKRKFAKLIKKDYAGVFRYFRSGYDPKLSTLGIWAKALKVKIKDLYIE